ncbi:MAG: nuclear transport factor 2 family protein [Janthinobacterium lividum]
MIAAMLLVAAPGVAAASDADILREDQDRAAITQLMWTYARAIDRFDETAYADVFTPDGAFGATKGREALQKMVTDLKKSRAEREAKGEPQPAMHHMEGNQYIEFVDRDHARFHYYWITVFGAGGPGSTQAPRVAAVGNGADDLVRVNGKWLIKYRNVVAKE